MSDPSHKGDREEVSYERALAPSKSFWGNIPQIDRKKSGSSNAGTDDLISNESELAETDWIKPIEPIKSTPQPMGKPLEEAGKAEAVKEEAANLEAATTKAAKSKGRLWEDDNEDDGAAELASHKRQRRN